MVELRRLFTGEGRSPFDDWHRRLDAAAALRVARALSRLAAGNPADSKPLGGGVFELRIDFGPGYRIYYGRAGERIIILIVGGDKRRQSQDIRRARRLWSEYGRGI